MFDKLDAIILTEEEIKEVNEGIRKNRNTSIFKHERYKDDKDLMFIDLYKMIYKLEVSTSDIAKLFNLSTRSIQLRLKDLDWSRDRYAAQKIAVTKRNYKDIMSKTKKTLLDNKLVGSSKEEYIRQLINIKLPQLISSGDVIIGLNNISILENGKEIDTPIIIFYNGKTYKFALEVNGNYWHQDDARDLKKNKALTELGYIPLRIVLTNSITNKQIGEKVNNLCELIYNMVLEEYYGAYI